MFRTFILFSRYSLFQLLYYESVLYPASRYDTCHFVCCWLWYVRLRNLTFQCPDTFYSAISFWISSLQPRNYFVLWLLRWSSDFKSLTNNSNWYSSLWILFFCAKYTESTQETVFIYLFSSLYNCFPLHPL